MTKRRQKTLTVAGKPSPEAARHGAYVLGKIGATPMMANAAGLEGTVQGRPMRRLETTPWAGAAALRGLLFRRGHGRHGLRPVRLTAAAARSFYNNPNGWGSMSPPS